MKRLIILIERKKTTGQIKKTETFKLGDKYWKKYNKAHNDKNSYIYDE